MQINTSIIFVTNDRRLSAVYQHTEIPGKPIGGHLVQVPSERPTI